MKNDINALMRQLTKNLKSNLTHKEHIAKEELGKWKDLIITGTAVIMDNYTVSYNKQVSPQLKQVTNNKLKIQHFNITKW